MAWTTIPNGDVDPESPITTSLMTALRDNVAAAMNGDASAPSLQTAAIAANAVTGAKISTSIASTGNTGSIGAGATWTPTSGLYMFGSVFNTGRIEIYVGGTWYLSVGNSGLVYADGTNMRLYNTAGSAVTYYYLKFN